MMSTAGAVFFGILPCFLYFEAFLGSVSGFAWDGGIVNIPAALIVVLMSSFLIRGTEGSSIFNGFIDPSTHQSCRLF